MSLFSFARDIGIEPIVKITKISSLFIYCVI
jgi:hypothetical protein